MHLFLEGPDVLPTVFFLDVWIFFGGSCWASGVFLMNLQRLCPHYFCSQCAKRTASLWFLTVVMACQARALRGPMFPRVYPSWLVHRIDVSWCRVRKTGPIANNFEYFQMQTAMGTHPHFLEMKTFIFMVFGSKWSYRYQHIMTTYIKSWFASNPSFPVIPCEDWCFFHPIWLEDFEDEGI